MNLKEEDKIRLIVEKNHEIIDAMTRLSSRILEDKPIEKNSKGSSDKDVENYIVQSKNTND